MLAFLCLQDKLLPKSLYNKQTNLNIMILVILMAISATGFGIYLIANNKNEEVKTFRFTSIDREGNKDVFHVQAKTYEKAVKHSSLVSNMYELEWDMIERIGNDGETIKVHYKKITPSRINVKKINRVEVD